MNYANLYRVTFDGQHEYVEAPTMGRAIEVWKAHAADTAKAFGDEWDGTEEPEECALIHKGAVMGEGAVIR